MAMHTLSVICNFLLWNVVSFTGCLAVEDDTTQPTALLLSISGSIHDDLQSIGEYEHKKLLQDIQ